MSSPNTVSQVETRVSDADVPTMPPALLRLGRTILYLTLIFAPLLMFAPNTVIYNPLDTPRRLVLFTCAGLLTALLVAGWAQCGRIVWRRHLLDLPVGLFTLGLLITSVTSAYPVITLWGPLWSQDGLLLMLVFVLLYLGTKTFLRTADEVRTAATIMVLVGGASALIGFCDFGLAQLVPDYASLNPTFAKVQHRLMSTLGNPMFAGTYFAMLIPLGIGVVQATSSKTLRTWLLIAIGLMVPALLLTQARAAWIGLALTVPVLLYCTSHAFPGWIRHLGRTAIIVGLVLLALLVGVAAGVPLVRNRLAHTINMEDETVRTRFVYMRGAIAMFLARPIQGWGVGNIRNVFPQFRPSSNVREMGMALDRAYSSAQPHNLFLQIAAEMGLLGLLPFLLLLWMLYFVGHRQWQQSQQAWMTIGILGFCTAYLFCNCFAFDNSVTMGLFWIVLGMLAASGAVDTPLPDGFHGLARPLTPPAVRGLTIAALVIAAGVALHLVMEMCAATYTLRAFNCVYRAAEVIRTDQKAAAKQYQLADALLTQSLPFTAAPSLRTGVRVGDLKTYQLWNQVYRAMLQLLKPEPSPKGFEEFYTTEQHVRYERAYAMFMEYSHRGLNMLDREPVILRSLIMQHQQDAEMVQALNQNARLSPDYNVTMQAAYERKLYEAFSAGYTDLRTLLVFEPHSAELYLLKAELMTVQSLEPTLGDYHEAEVAANLATEIDPTFAEAYARMAYYENAQVKLHSPYLADLVVSICNNYTRAERLDLELNDQDLLIYATNLFFMGKVQDGVEHGRRLNPEARQELADAVRIIFQKYKRPDADLQATLQALNTTPSTDASTPPSDPLNNFLRRR